MVMPPSSEANPIQITGRTVLRIGDFLLTIEPIKKERGAIDTPPSPPKSDLAKRLAAEEELQSRTQIPFDMSGAIRRSPRLSVAPKPGDQFSVDGKPRVIARVAVEFDGHWAVIDQSQCPALLRREGAIFVFVPPAGCMPKVGELVFTGEINIPITEVLGEAETGGWAVRTQEDRGTTRASHVIHLRDERWAMLAHVEV
jgi:hypothetical protein